MCGEIAGPLDEQIAGLRVLGVPRANLTKLSLTADGPSLSIEELSDAELASLRRRLDESGIGCYCVTSPVAKYAVDTDPAKVDRQLSRSIDRLRRYAEDAGRDPSEIEVVYHGAAYRDREEQMVDGERSMFTGSQSQVAEDIRELEGMGVQNVMLEIVGKDLDATLERMEQFASRAMPLARSGG